MIKCVPLRAMKRGRLLLVAALPLLAAAACGGAVGAPNQPSLGDGGGHDSRGGQGSAGDDEEVFASSSGGSGAISGSNGSGGTPSGSGSSGGTSGSISDPATTCASACLSGQICCATIIASPPGSTLPPGMATSCQEGPCPSFAGMPLQVCSTAAECFTTGDICAPPFGEASIPVMLCQPPRGDGG